jgi:predicted O-methyltransferase YrrM
MRVLAHFALWSLGLASAETQTTEAERDCLARHAAGKKRGAEIGVWHGVTTCRLRKAMAADATLFAGDPFPAGRLGFSAQRIIANREVSRLSMGNVQWIRQTGAEAAHSLRGSGLFDFVFIDGDHSYEGLEADWTGWSRLLASGGVIALHDSRSTPERPISNAGSVLFTQEVILADRRFEMVETVDSLTVVQRIADPQTSSPHRICPSAIRVDESQTT